MTTRPFLTRLFLPFAIVMAIIVAVCGGVIYFAGQRAVEFQQARELDRLTALVRQWLGGNVGGDMAISPEMDKQLRQAAEFLAARITLVAPDGVVFFDTHGDVAAMDNHNNRPEIIDARRGNGRAGINIRQSDTIGEPAVYVAEPLDRSDPDGVIIRLSYSQRYWAPLDTPVWAIVTGGVASALLAALVLARVLRRQWIEPVRSLASAAERMAAGDWTPRVEPRGAGEIQSFSNQLNRVAANAQSQVTELERQRADLQSLMDTLPDPLLVADAKQRLIHLNAPAARLFDLTPARAVGQRLPAAVTDASILQLCEDFISQQQPSLQRETDLYRDGRRQHFQTSVTRTAANGVLLVLRDVSALSQAVQMKSDFVANASHELRTPIAALKAAFETLDEARHDDPEQVERCVRIMDGHLRRLEEMLADLLDLSRVESAELAPQLTTIRIDDVFASLQALLAPFARQKNVELSFESEPKPLSFLSDERLLHLVLKNLAENSLKFTPARGHVTVRAACAEESITLSVTDSGIGIPPEHLDRVFERFYQVNPARTGAAGRGTGLGLAIVKHAVAALGGRVQLRSVIGSGTTVTCTISLRDKPPAVTKSEIENPNG